MTAINNLIQVRRIHNNAENSSRHIRTNMSSLCRKQYVFTMRPMRTSNNSISVLIIILMISNEIILLLYSFNLITTSFRYRINYLRNPNLNMVGVCRNILVYQTCCDIF
jgi:hypothetical protein